MRLGWYVFMHCPDGDVAPVTKFWRKRTAREWVRRYEQSQGHLQLEVHRYSWRGNPTQRSIIG